MRVITDTELARRTDGELALLFDTLAQALGRTKPGTPDRSAVIAGLQNIGRARALRHRRNRVPGF